MNLTENQLHILRHSLGLDSKGRGKQYRNGYATALECDGYQDVLVLVAGGYMQKAETHKRYEVYCVTATGKLAAMAPKTISQQRYQRFLDADSGLSFREWLQTKWGRMEV